MAHGFFEFPTFKLGQSFSAYRTAFFHRIAKSNLKYMPEESWEHCDYNCLIDWIRLTLLWNGLGHEAKQMATAARLCPKSSFTATFKLDLYAQELTDFFDKTPPRDHYNEYHRDVFDELHRDNAIEQLFSQHNA